MFSSLKVKILRCREDLPNYFGQPLHQTVKCSNLAFLKNCSTLLNGLGRFLGESFLCVIESYCLLKGYHSHVISAALVFSFNF